MQGVGSSSPLSENHYATRSVADSKEHGEKSAGSANVFHSASRLPVSIKTAKNRLISSSPSIKQEKFNEILKEVLEKNSTQRSDIDIGKILVENGYSKNISSIDLCVENEISLKGMKIDGITFEKCKFNWSHLSESEISCCVFKECEMKNVSFMNSRITASKFESCVLTEAMFVNTQLHGIQFLNSTIERSSFEDAKITNYSLFSRVKMPSTHFFSASVSKSNIRNSDLTDTVFFGNKDSVKNGFYLDTESRNSANITKPVTATLVFPESRGVSVPLVGEKITDIADAIPVRLVMQTPTVQKADLDSEVEVFLRSAKRDDANPLPIPQQLLRAIQEDKAEYLQFESAAKIFNKTKLLAGHVNAIVLPGGEDVSPLLYGQAQHEKTDWKGDYRRSIMELGLIHQAFNKGIPLMAICRGFQMTSVYFGAKLEQHIGGRQVGVQVLGEDAFFESDGEKIPQGVFGDIKQNIRAAVYHHQALPVENNMQHLGPVLTHTVTDENSESWEVIMAIEPINPSAPIIGVQFHPEFLKSDSVSKNESVLSNDELITLAHPEADAPGLRSPADMLDSGILEHMSSGNDELWKVLSTASDTHRNKAGITASVLAQKKSDLKTSAYSSKLAALNPGWKGLKGSS